jgi:hypothetical protein
MNLIYTPEGKKHLLECLIDPRERIYTYVTNTINGQTYTRSMPSTDLPTTLHYHIEAAKLTPHRTKLEIYTPVIMELLAYIDFEEKHYDPPN